ncbi:MAG: ferrous iron transport protein B [Desulfopila sp.]
MKKQILVALAGNPNAGKTTLFNQLTGSRQHVGNYPGITVDYKEGVLTHKSRNIQITDLPGTYSLTAYSMEEIVARDYLTSARPQVVINIVDASNLQRNLYLSCQLIELGVPLVIALNMVDVAEKRGMHVDTEKLERLLGVPVIAVVARSGKGVDQLIEAAVKVADEGQSRQSDKISYGEDLEGSIQRMRNIIEGHEFFTESRPSLYTALKYLEHDDVLCGKGREKDAAVAAELEEISNRVSDHTKKTLGVYPEVIIADHRYGFIKSMLKEGIISHRFARDRLYTSDKIDMVLTNRLIGPAIMLAVLYGVYQFTFTWSELPVVWLENFFGWLGAMVETSLSDGLLKSMLISGVIDGVGGVLGFVPLIMFMFFSIAILEDTGYLARVAYMMDRLFRIFGLHGSSVMPYIVSGGIAGGCAVPGVMATRALKSPKERMATLLTVPFMNCGAKLPVLALLIGTFFSDNKAQYMFFFTLLAWFVALLAAKFFRATVLKGTPTPFVMELPPYRFPTLQGLAIHTWERTWQYIKKAGTVILGISILLWALMTFPELPDERSAYYEEQRLQYTSTSTNTGNTSQADKVGPASTDSSMAADTATINDISRREKQEALQHSIAGRIGSFLEPLSSLAGFDWRTNIALVGGFAAKEVIVSTLGTAYSMGDVDAEAALPLGEKLKNDPAWNKITAISALLFVMFYAPCFVTVVCIARESSWKWAFFSITFNTVFAFTLAVATFQLGSLIA